MTEQKPIGSGFGAKSTAADVIAGIALHGRRAIVTGGYSGIGLEVVRALTGAGAEVLVPARRPDVAREVLFDAGLSEGAGAGLDLADLASVRAFAQRYLHSGAALDILIDNAAVMAAPLTRV